MLNNILAILGVSVISGFVYHIAGIGGFKGAKLIRRVVCPFLALGLFLGLKGLNLGYWWAYLLFLGLNYAALSTYHDYLAPDGSSENWLCWIMTGLGYGLAALPLIWCGVHLLTIITRSIFLAISIMWLRERTGKNWLEEFGSGFLYLTSVPILII